MTKKEIKAKATEAMDYLDSVSRYYQGRVFCVNVKRHHEDFDIEKIASKYPKMIREAILEEFGGEEISEGYYQWLNDEASYFIDDLLKNDCQDRKDVKKHMPYLKDKLGFYGRSGGWFGVNGKVYEEFEELLLDLDDDYTLDQIYQYHDIEGMLAEVEAVKWVLDEADKFNKGLDYQDELIFRIEEFVENIKIDIKNRKEVKTAKTLAEKHGYILARAI